ncbi:MAG TPA: alpha/beta fold hydrolase [Steroidobacteraceae bacterium]|nr:alpha/beta fold hydrolase [Steroidobacteraceae bacterium]
MVSGASLPAARRATVLLLLSLTAALAAAGRALAAGQITLSPCELRQSQGLTLIQARCGRLPVPENPAAPQGRKIGLRVAVVPAISTHARPDPLFVLAGGPGMAATSFYASVAPVFARIHRDRDIVLLDQRGTGGSNALACESSQEDLYRSTTARIVTETERCLKMLRAHAHVRFYTTSLAVRDLDRVRAALGYRRINLYGSSYGTIVAQEYIRRYPHRVRSVILDGVVPPQLALGATSALDAQASLTGIFSRCAREPACHARFGDPAASYRQVRDELGGHPRWVDLTDPTSGEPYRLQFNSDQLAMILRLASYTPQLAALLPLDLHEGASGNFAPLAGQFLLIDRRYGNAIAEGMNDTVVCSEDVPFYHVTAKQRAELARTFLGTSQLDGLEAICKNWPRGPVDPDFHQPLHSHVPALLLSGRNDPVTPPRYAALARRGFAQSLSLVIPGFGHGQLTDPCMGRVMSQFVRLASVVGLDTACTRRLSPMPFFLTRNGPAP